METRCHLHNMQVKKTSIQEVEEEGEEEAQQREVTQEELYASIGAFKPPKGWDVVALTQEQHEQLHTKKFQWSNKRVNLIPQCLWLGGIAMGGLGAVCVDFLGSSRSFQSKATSGPGRETLTAQVMHKR
jgi:hypothetical protein